MQSEKNFNELLLGTATALMDPDSESEAPPPPTFTEYSQATFAHELHTWQSGYLCPALEEAAITAGAWVLLHGPPRYGKPVSDESMVLMGDGSYKRIADIEVGEYVISGEGVPRKVTAVHIQGKLPCVRITTKSGRETVAAFDHPFWTPRGWVNAGDLAVRDVLACVREPETCPTSEWSISNHELAGYFIGDGCCLHNLCTITSADEDQAERIQEVASNLGFGCSVYEKKGSKAKTYSLKGGARQWLRDVGLAGKGSLTKTVPEWVFTAEKEDVAAFLGAYFSCDGNVSPKGKDRHGNDRPDATCEFYSISKELLVGVQRLLLRVGVQSRIAEKNGKYRGDRHKSWRLTFSDQDDVAQFHSEVPVPGLKGEQLRNQSLRRKNFPGKYLSDQIVKIEKAGMVPCRCLTVEKDSTFTSDDFVVHNSMFASIRLVAWLIGCFPAIQIGVASYNETHSEEFSQVVMDLMQSETHKKFFPKRAGQLINNRQPRKQWQTFARRDAMDGSYSFVSLGLNSGAAGKGFDVLIIDDPYANYEDSVSEATNKQLQQWWINTIKPRLKANASVIFMFHRWHENDFIGWIQKQEKNRWKMIRFPAVADDNLDGSDPTGRQPGELLSDIKPLSEIQELQKDPLTFSALYQGRPISEGKKMFLRERFHIIDPGDFPEMEGECSFWDLAASQEKGADAVANARVGVAKGRIFIRRVKAFREEWPETRKNIIQTAREDPAGILTAVERNAMQIIAVQSLQRHPIFMSHTHLVGVMSKGSKKERANVWAALARRGRVYIADDSNEEEKWVEDFLDECEAFDGLGLSHDDRVDAVSGAIAALAQYLTDDEEEPIEYGTPEYWKKKYAERQAFIEETEREISGRPHGDDADRYERAYGDAGIDDFDGIIRL